MLTAHLAAALLAFTQPSAAASQCGRIDGAELVVGRASARYVIVGERHGTAEIPPFFGDLVCLASARGPVVVGLEVEGHQQASLNAYLLSDGSPAARAALLRHDHWRNRDGRATVAKLEMIEQLRRLRAGGRTISVLAFMRSVRDPVASERGMAEAWTEALREQPAARLFALIGSVHAEAESIGFMPSAASYLPPAQRLTLSYGPANRPGAAPRILNRVPAEHAWPRYDLHYSVGAFTVSPLAREQFGTP